MRGRTALLVGIVLVGVGMLALSLRAADDATNNADNNGSGFVGNNMSNKGSPFVGNNAGNMSTQPPALNTERIATMASIELRV